MSDLLQKARDDAFLSRATNNPHEVKRAEFMEALAARIEALEAERDAAFAAGFEVCREMAEKAAADYTPRKHTAALASHVTGKSIQSAIRELRPEQHSKMEDE